MTTTTTPFFVEITEASAALGLSEAFLRRVRITAKRVPFVKVGGKVLYDLAACRASLSALQVGGTAKAQ